jgi:threonine/homoserine/homoserine lactone efflux protein
VGTLTAEVAALGLAIAFTSPVSVVTVILLLSLSNGRRRAFAFVVGWLTAIAIIAVLTATVLHGQDFSSNQTSPSRAASIAEIVLGCLLLIGSAVAYRRRKGSTQSTPKWLDRLDRTNWLVAVAVGSFMLTYSLCVVAVAEILKGNVSTGDEAVAFLVFALASIVTIVAPIVVAIARPERSEQTLARWRRWLLGNSRAIALIMLMVIGALVIARGTFSLVT